MNARLLVLILLLILSSAVSLATELTTRLFAKSPAPGPGEFDTPRVLAINPATSTCYVLDSGMGRVVSTTPDGQQLKSWMLKALGVETPLPIDPLLPNPALAAAGETVYLLNLDRGEMLVELVTLEGEGEPRVVTLPDGAMNGAVTVDSAGRVLAAFMQVGEKGMTLALARENANGKMSILNVLEDVCDGQTKDLCLTGFVVMPDGRFAIGVAQGGNANYGMVRSWLAQGALRNGALGRPMEVTHRFSLLNAQKNVQERFMAAVTLAGRCGYPAKACVPLFTALLVMPDGTVISGGHSLDPFLRFYEKEETLLHSVPRQAVGGQHLAMLPAKNGNRLFAAAPAAHRILELTPDGRERGGFGSGPLYSLAQPVSLAANKNLVFIAVAEKTEFRLVCLSSEGRFRWAQSLAPPAKLAQAQPVLATSTGGRVFVGWKLPNASGVGWVETLMEDGSAGVPFWPEPSAQTARVDSGPCMAPLMTGSDGRVYVLREMNEGVRLQAYSATGAFLLQYSANNKGMPFTSSTVGATWLRLFGEDMWFVTYGPDGKEQKWKRLPRSGRDARFSPVLTGELWGWLTSTKSLVKFDDKLTLVDEMTLNDPDGETIEHPAAMAGDGAGRIYLALPDRILSVDP